VPNELVLIDSSVWIEFYRPQGGKKLKQQVIDCISSDLAAVNQLIALEVRRGAADEDGFTKITEDMAAFNMLDADHRVWDRAAAMGFELRTIGLSVPTIDLIIAATALIYDCELWHNDKHFELIADKYPIRTKHLKTREKVKRRA